jgi:dTDP-4-dehydrorhamnose 3,5-epimerase
MIFRPTRLKDAFTIDLEKSVDERGFFARAWCAREFEEHGLNPRLVQANIGYSEKRGTVRGMHYQLAPYEEAKLVRCIRGAIHDVIVDLRPDSPTYRQWLGVELNADNRRMLYVPESFAHGYLTLANDTETLYQVSQFYTPGAERGFRWNDPAFGIEWPVTENLTISEKDQAWPDFSA